MLCRRKMKHAVSRPVRKKGQNTQLLKSRESTPSASRLLWFLFVCSLTLGFVSDLQQVGWDPGALALLTLNGGILAILIFWLVIAPVKHLIGRYWDWRDKPFKKLILSISISAFGSVILLYGELSLFMILFEDPENDPYKNFHDLLIAFLIAAIAAAIYNASDFFVSWKKDLLRSEMLEKQRALAQLEALKSQLNPHFLFNSLNTLSSLTLSDPVKARESIRQLAKVYRYVLENRQIDMVPIRQELEFLKAYVDLLETRFGSALQISIKGLNDLNTFVAPLVLQILVENAIKHNVVSIKNPLYVSIFTERDTLIVLNNLQPRGTKPFSAGLGIESIVTRYRHITTEPVSVSSAGNLFTVKVPLILHAANSNITGKYEGGYY